VEGEIVLSDIE